MIRELVLILLITVSITSLNVYSSLGYKYTRSIVLYAPAVTSSGSGVLSKLKLTIAYPGRGYVYFSAHPLTELDTQATARVAALVASSLANKDYYSYDYYVVMESPSMVIGGPSAGALMTIGFLALMLNTSIYSNITMTGMVNPDGTIGPVGGLKGKLEAVASHGFKVFLIPLGERYVTVPNVTVKRFPWGIFRRVTYTHIDLVSYGRRLGVSVIEVSSIREAYSYFTGYNFSINYSLSRIELMDKLYDTLTNQTVCFLENSTEYANLTRELIPQISIWYRGSIRDLVREVERMVEETRSYLDNGYAVLAFNNGLKTLYRALSTYWLTLYLSDNADQEYFIEQTNTTLIKSYNIVSSLLDNNTYTITYYEILTTIYSKYVDAREYFSKGVNALQEGSIVDGIDYLAHSYSLYYDISSWSRVIDLFNETSVFQNMSKVYDVALVMYSIADSTTSYAYTLAEDLGVRSSYLDKAMDYLDRAHDALFENNSIDLTGESILATVYATIAVHKMFISNKSVEEVLVKHVFMEARVCLEQLSIVNTSSILPEYYYIYAREFMEVGEYSQALLPALLSILHSRKDLLIVSYSGGVVLEKTNPYTTTPPLTPNPSTSPSVLGYTGLSTEFKWFIYGLVTGILVSIIIVVFVKSYREVSTKREFGGSEQG